MRAVARHRAADLPAGVEIVEADITDPVTARRAMVGAAIVYHAASAPYHRWPELLPPLMHGVIAGASATGAPIVYADNLYAFAGWGIDRAAFHFLLDAAAQQHYARLAERTVPIGNALLSVVPDTDRPGWSSHYLRKGRARTDWSTVTTHPDHLMHLRPCVAWPR